MESTILSWSDSKDWTSKLPAHNEMSHTLKNVGCLFYLLINKTNVMSNIYWRMRNGKYINVDDMDNNHVRNAFKMLLRNLNKGKKQSHFTLNGDMAKEFNENFYADIDDIEYDGDMWYKP